jgi:hypothetical protein
VRASTSCNFKGLHGLYRNSFTFTLPLPSAKRTNDMLNLNRDEFRWTVVLFKGHCHLKEHLFKQELTDDPFWERCLEKAESVTHILLCGHRLFKISSRGPVAYGTKWLLLLPIKKVLHFTRSVGLIKN